MNRAEAFQARLSPQGLGGGNSIFSQLQRQMLSGASPQVISDANAIYAQGKGGPLAPFRAIRTAMDQERLTNAGTMFPGTQFSLVNPTQFSSSRFGGPPSQISMVQPTQSSLMFGRGPYAQLAMQLAGLLGK